MTFDQDIDAVGLICPLPVLRAAKALRGMTAGDVLRICADDPVAIIDIPHFCMQAGHELISQTNEDDHQVYFIKCGT